MARILVTGATGFIGANLVHRLAGSGDRISVLLHGKKPGWRIRQIIPKLDVHVADITDIRAVRSVVKKTRPDIVYHLATYGVYPRQDEPARIIDTNIAGSANLMISLSEYGRLEKFVNLGSSFEYGPKPHRISETETTEPTSIYGISKVSQTSIAQFFATQKGLPAVTLRVFNAYGMFEEGNRLVPGLMLAALRGGTLKIRNPRERRDFVFVGDVVDALIRASKLKKSGIIVNVGTSTGITVEDLVRRARRVTGMDIKVAFGESTSREYGTLIADARRARQVLHWGPKFPIDEGLAQTFGWFRQNLALYR